MDLWSKMSSEFFTTISGSDTIIVNASGTTTNSQQSEAPVEDTEVAIPAKWKPVAQNAADLIGIGQELIGISTYNDPQGAQKAQVLLEHLKRTIRRLETELLYV